MRKLLYWFFGIAVVIQLIRPDFSNPKSDAKLALQTDAPTLAILKTSCYDCHSNETKYPWYSKVAPSSWLLAANIEDGRKALNFSTWASIESDIKLKRLERAKQLINRGDMPKSEYCLMHKNAILTAVQKATLQQFFDAEIQKITPQ